jgi:hypothetical protein
MRLKKWRGAQGIMVFVNGFQPDDVDGFPGPAVSVAINGVTSEQTWRTSTKGAPPLTPKQLRQLEEYVSDLSGVSPGDGFDDLLKQVEW